MDGDGDAMNGDGDAMNGDGDAMNGDGDTKTPDACDAGPSQACVDARQAELDAIEADDDATVGALNAAEMALADAQTAFSGANTAAAEEMTVSGLIDDAMTATADIDDESTPAAVAAGRAAIDAAKESLGGMENLSDDATVALQGRIDVLEAGYSPIEMTVETNAAKAAAATKRTEIGAEFAQEVEAGLGGSLPTGVTDSTYSMTISRDRDGTTVEIADTAMADDDPKFTQAMDFGDGRTMHVRVNSDDEDGKVEEVVIVKTDIAAPKATPFAMVRNPEGELTQVLNANPETTGGDDFQSRTVGNDATTAPDEAQRALVKSADFAPAQARSLHLRSPDSKWIATWRWVAIRLSKPSKPRAPTTTRWAHTSAMPPTKTCTVTLDAKGAITAMSGGWIFTPATGAKSYVADAGYLRYGFWLMRTTKDGATTYNEVETFAEAMGIRRHPHWRRRSRHSHR